MAANEYKIKAAGGLVIPVLSSDPSSPSDGAIWYNSTSGVIKKREGGTTTSVPTALTAGDGIDITSFVISVLTDGEGLETGSGSLVLELDGSTLSKSASGVKVADGGITNTQVSASAAIDYSKLAALSTDKALVSDGSGFVSASSVTATELGYVAGVTSSIQDQLDGKLNLSGGTMTGFLTLSADPTNALHAATKQYVDAAITNGIHWKEPVRVATTTAGTLATDFEDGDTVDGIVLATGDRILIKNQVDESEDGIYMVEASGAPTRTSDADAFGELNGAVVFVLEGTVNADRGYMQTGELTDFSGQSWVQNFGTGLYTADGNGIELSGQTFSLELDGSTLSKSASGLKVADGGITNTQVSASAAIDYSKLAALSTDKALVSDGSGFVSASSVTATELGYVSGVTSSIQDQLDAKLNLSGGTMTGALTMGDQVLVHGSNGQRQGQSASEYYETEYLHALTLTASSTNAVESSLSFDHTVYSSQIVEYSITEATTGAVRTGSLYIASDGTTASITDQSTETADVGTDWNVNISGSTTQVRYTTTANDKTMRCTAKRFVV